MGRGSRATCNLTVDQLMAERPKRASVGGAMHYLATCTPEERIEALSRADAAFEEIRSKPTTATAPAAPTARTKLYLKRNFVPVTFVVLDDRRADRGTMQGSADGSIRRAFWFDARDIIIEQESEQLMLAGIPRWRRARVNEKFKLARLGWTTPAELDGEWTDEQRAIWAVFCKSVDETEAAIEKARRPVPRRRTYTGLNPW